MATQQLSRDVSNFLTRKYLPPSAQWLEAYISTARTTTPLPALQKTALFRLLASDLTTSVQVAQANLLPPNILDPTTQEQTISGPVPCQVLDIEDVGRSRWSQVESIQAFERGESTRGREVVRVVAGDQGENGEQVPTAPSAGGDNNSDKGSGPHKLLLQDASGAKVYAFELMPVDGLGINKMAIGAKLVLRNTLVARGVVMLEPRSVEVLGGKVSAWDESWRASRKDRLKDVVGAPREDR